MDLDSLVKSLLGELNKISKSEAVVGNVRDAGKAKVMPLSKISIGFGAASAGAGGKTKGDSKSDAGLEGGGVGGAVVVEPKAFVVVGEDGVPHMLALQKGKGAVARRGIEILPSGNGRAQLGGASAPQLEGKDKPKKPGA